VRAEDHQEQAESLGQANGPGVRPEIGCPSPDPADFAKSLVCPCSEPSHSATRRILAASDDPDHDIPRVRCQALSQEPSEPSSIQAQRFMSATVMALCDGAQR
jgi:hypothetical protein